VDGFSERGFRDMALSLQAPSIPFPRPGCCAPGLGISPQRWSSVRLPPCWPKEVEPKRILASLHQRGLAEPKLPNGLRTN
jgi:hypothetical protein